MIVGSCFADDNLDVAWRQHDVYNNALETIVVGTNRYARMARRVLNDDLHAGWGDICHFDHRTLQGAHDLLAAAWRWQHINPQLDFTTDTLPEVEDAWLTWLSHEVESWFDAPEFIRLVQIILSHQNQEAGYAAEANLGLEILDRFQDVPWLDGQRESLTLDSRKYPPSILSNAVVHSSERIDPQNGDRFPLAGQGVE